MRAMLMVRDLDLCALGSDIGAGGDVGCLESSVGERQGRAPGSRGEELLLGLSAGEVGVRSGGSGIGGGRDREHQQEKREERRRAGTGQASIRATGPFRALSGTGPSSLP